MSRLNLILTLLISFQTYGQDCSHVNLSTLYDYQTSAVLGKIPGQEDDGIFEMKIGVIRKGTGHKQQLITFLSGMMHFHPFKDCNAVRFYTTGFNAAAEVMDDDYGDLVVADFNFDGREDLAAKREAGGNGGPLYNYYLQDKAGIFVIDSFLSETMIFFPTEFNTDKKTLMTLVHANAHQMRETTYKFNTKTGQWKEIRQRLVGYN